MDGISNVNIKQQLELMGMAKKGSTSSSQQVMDTDGTGFAKSLDKAITDVNALQKVSDQKVEDLATGKSSNLHETMISVEKADIALRLMVQVRNKMIDAYQEIMKMQV